MQLTAEQILQLAPDARSLTAARKAARPRLWREVGRSAEALWGRCQGTGLYDVVVDLVEVVGACSCPSRKRPCKHVLGLLLWTAEEPAAIAPVAPPDWVTTWVDQQRDRASRREARKERGEVADLAAQARRRAEREQKVAEGVAALELWLADLMRQGLAEQAHAPEVFERQAARLIDAQAGGLAARVRRIGEEIGRGRDWPERVLAALGRLSLLLQAYGRLEQLPPGLAADVRALVGWNVARQDVAADGATQRDRWVVAGQREERDDERISTQRTWLVGADSGRVALLLQYAPAGQTYAERLTPGTAVDAELSFYPGATAQRALIRARHTSPEPWRGRLPGAGGVELQLARCARELAAQPWQTLFFCHLRDVQPSCDAEGWWYVRDRRGLGLGLYGREHWRLAALAGGHPCDLVGEWDGAALTPLAVAAPGDGVYRWVSIAPEAAP